MRLDNPLFLFGLALIPLLYRYMLREGPERSAAIRYSDTDYISGSVAVKKNYFSTIFGLRTFCLVILILALARPQLEKGFETITGEGIDIMLALDISGSMQAEDFKPRNRLYVAKQVVSDFLTRVENDRVGLVVFAARSFTRCPLTLDYDILKSMLEDVDIGMIEDGTAIGLALANCVARLRESDAKSKVIILLTDGVNNRGEIDPLTAASLAKAAGMRVYTIGVGKEGGAPIPIVDRYGRKRYATNPDGSLVMTELDEETLKQIASITGGRYYRATNEQALDEIYKRILEMEKTAFEVRRFKHRKELAPYILPLAVLAMLFEVALVNVIWRKIP